MAGHKLWVELGDGNVAPVKYSAVLVYAEPMTEIPNGPAGDPEVSITLTDLIAAYNTLHGTDYTNY